MRHFGRALAGDSIGCRGDSHLERGSHGPPMSRCVARVKIKQSFQLRLKELGVTSPTIQYDRGQRRHQVMAAVLSEVFAGRLRPGQHLVTQQLAERLGVSHTPIREALIALAGMGILEWVPNRGAVVRSVGRREVEEICQVRRLLECAATRRACGRIGLAELERLREEFLGLQGVDVHRLAPRQARRFIDRARAADNSLHDLIAASCGNAFLAQELERLKLLFRVFRDIAWQQEDARHDYRRLATEAGEHLAIVEALLRNEPRAAARAMSAHVRSGARYWGRSLLANRDGYAMPVSLSGGRSPTPHRDSMGNGKNDNQPTNSPLSTKQESVERRNSGSTHTRRTKHAPSSA